MPTVSTFLMFDGHAEEAVMLYTSLIPNSSVAVMKKYAADGAGKEGSVEIASFTLNGTPFSAIDTPVPHEFTFTPATSIFLTCADAAQVDALFSALSEGGEVFMPLDTYPFSARFVWFSDKFGLSWQLTV